MTVGNSIYHHANTVLNAGSVVFGVDLSLFVFAVSYLTYGSFSSYAPVYDSTTANISKQQSDMLLSTYADETGVQYSKRYIIDHKLFDYLSSYHDPLTLITSDIYDFTCSMNCSLFQYSALC